VYGSRRKKECELEKLKGVNARTNRWHKTEVARRNKVILKTCT